MKEQLERKRLNKQSQEAASNKKLQEKVDSLWDHHYIKEEDLGIAVESDEPGDVGEVPRAWEVGAEGGARLTAHLGNHSEDSPTPG